MHSQMKITLSDILPCCNIGKYEGKTTRHYDTFIIIIIIIIIIMMIIIIIIIILINIYIAYFHEK